MLEAHQVSLRRGVRQLFEALSFTLRAGDLLRVHGANGVGKTSLLRVLCGITRAQTGRVLWKGHTVEDEPLNWGRDLAYCGHLPGLKSDLTVEENLRFYARLYGLRGTVWLDSLRVLGVLEQSTLEIRSLSAGQKRRVALARVLMQPAELWVLDEPFANLDQAGRSVLENCLDKHLRKGGIAVVAAHHSLVHVCAAEQSLHLT